MAIPVYPSDLTDAECILLSILLPPAKPGGRPRSVSMRRIVNGLFYFPRDYGPWPTVFHYFRQFPRDETWEWVHARLRELALEWVGGIRHRAPPSSKVNR